VRGQCGRIVLCAACRELQAAGLLSAAGTPTAMETQPLPTPHLPSSAWGCSRSSQTRSPWRRLGVHKRCKRVRLCACAVLAAAAAAAAATADAVIASYNAAVCVRLAAVCESTSSLSLCARHTSCLTTACTHAGSVGPAMDPQTHRARAVACMHATAAPSLNCALPMAGPDR